MRDRVLCDGARVGLLSARMVIRTAPGGQRPR